MSVLLYRDSILGSRQTEVSVTRKVIGEPVGPEVEAVNMY